MLDNPEPDRITTSEKKPLLIDFFVLWRIIDVKQYYVSTQQGDEEVARRRLSTDGPREPARGDSTSARCTRRSPSERDKIMATTRQKADADAKTFGVEIVDVRLRRVELPPDVTGPVYARMESERRRVANELRSLGQAESEKIRADADRQREVILADAYRAGAEAQGRRRRQGRVDLRAGLRRESRVLRVLPQPRGVQVDVPRQERHAWCSIRAPTSSAISGARRGQGAKAPR